MIVILIFFCSESKFRSIYFLMIHLRFFNLKKNIIDDENESKIDYF